MKLITIALGILGLILLMVVTVAGRVGPDSNMPSAVPTSLDREDVLSQPDTTPTSAQRPYILVKTPAARATEPEIPVFPGAIALTDKKKDRRLWFRRLLTWQANGSYENVLAFYRERLAEQGWRRLIYPIQSRVETTEEGIESTITFDPNTDPYFGLTYYWTDNTGVADYRLRLGLVIGKSERDGQEVRATVQRVPDENKIPLFIDAEQIEVSGDAKERVISYLSDSPAFSLVDFYDNLAPEYGWSAWKAEENVVRLSYNEESMEYGLGPWLYGVVMMHEEMQNKTKVEIHLTGLDSFNHLEPNP